MSSSNPVLILQSNRRHCLRSSDTDHRRSFEDLITTVIVQKLFFAFPVRLQAYQREFGSSSNVEAELVRLERDIFARIVSCHPSILVNTRETCTKQTFKLQTPEKCWDKSDYGTALKTFQFARNKRMDQIMAFDADLGSIWQSVRKTLNGLHVEAAFALKLVRHKRAQFISANKIHLLSTIANILYDAVNSVFIAANFGEQCR